MNLSPKTYCLSGATLIIAAILGVLVLFSIHPPNGFSELAVQLPPVGQPLSSKQLVEVGNSNGSFAFMQQDMEIFVDVSFLTGSLLLITGIVRYLRKMKTVQNSN